MSNYDNTNSGVLWKNNRKDKPKSPDHRGTIELGADIMADLSEKFKSNEKMIVNVASWTKQKKDGEDFYSLALSKYTPRDESKTQPKSNGESSHEDDNIPF